MIEMKKEKFITVMAIFDDDTQKKLHNIQDNLELQYGIDTKTKGIPYHISLGSYPVEKTDEIVSRIINVTNKTKRFAVKFKGLNHFGNVVRYMEPEISDALIDLHMHFDSDYANGFNDWVPHVTVYRHSEPKEIELSKYIVDKIENLTNAEIVGIELGEFFPPRHIIRVLFNQ